MNYYSYKRLNPNDVLVYVEEFDKESNTVVFDFVDSNEYRLFTVLTNRIYELGTASMVLIKNYKLKPILENTVYAINQSTIQTWQIGNRIDSGNNNSYLIGYIIELSNSETELFTNSVSINPFYDFQLNNKMYSEGNLDKVLISLKGDLSVIIRDVGQGNWNEIMINSEVKIVYDAGASMYAKTDDIRKIIDDRNVMYDKSKPGLFLSHWDKDHYHSLIGMTNDELSNFSFFVCRDEVPNLTSRILFGRISKAVGIGNTITLKAEPRNSGRGPIRLVPLTSNSSQLMIYNAQYHKNRNISGIVLSLKTFKSSVVFAGDAHYEQISRDILPHLNYKHEHHLVVPHHGGKAGYYIYNLTSKVKKGIAVVSVGANHYGHPFPIYIDSLNLDMFNVKRTQIVKNDIKINL